MTGENSLVNNLLQVAKELKKAEFVRNFKKEFENEISNEKMETDALVEKHSGEEASQVGQEETEGLRMEVFEDKDYDIEEVKFWNFISKNKGMKPSIIRTVVYKYPESSYVVKKMPVYLPKPDKPICKNSPVKETDKKQVKEPATLDSLSLEQTETLTSSVNQVKRQVGRPKALSTTIKPLNTKPEKTQSTSQPVSKIEKLQTNVLGCNNKTSEQLNELLKTSRATRINESTKQKLAASTSTHFLSKNYKMEDMILIDEDDDIIGYNESDEENELAEAVSKANELEEQAGEIAQSEIVLEEEHDLNKEDNKSDVSDEDTDILDTDDLEISEDDEKIDEPDNDNDTEQEEHSPQVVLETLEESPAPKRLKQRGPKRLHQATKQNKKVMSVSVLDNYASKTDLKKSKLQGNAKSSDLVFSSSTDQVTRVTRSRSKLGTCLGNQSPASSTTSSNR